MHTIVIIERGDMLKVNKKDTRATSLTLSIFHPENLGKNKGTAS